MCISFFWLICPALTEAVQYTEINFMMKRCSFWTKSVEFSGELQSRSSCTSERKMDMFPWLSNIYRWRIYLWNVSYPFRKTAHSSKQRVSISGTRSTIRASPSFYGAPSRILFGGPLCANMTIDYSYTINLTHALSVLFFVGYIIPFSAWNVFTLLWFLVVTAANLQEWSGVNLHF